MTATIARIKSSRPATVRGLRSGLPTKEAAMQRAREAEERLARHVARRNLRVRLIWLALGVVIGFTACWFSASPERPVTQQVRR